jgi:hypothetical protein
MIRIKEPEKEVQKILKDLETGKANQSRISYLMELLHYYPSMTPSVIEELNNILIRGNIKSYDSVMSIFNIFAEKDIELIADSVDHVARCLKKEGKDYHEDWKLKALGVLLKIYDRYPERLGSSVPELFVCLENASPLVRDKAYFLLTLLAARRPELFNGCSEYLIHVLNGLYENERIHACKLIEKIADKNPKIIWDLFDILEDISLHHPHSKLRLQAAKTLEKIAGSKRSVRIFQI